MTEISLDVGATRALAALGAAWGVGGSKPKLPQIVGLLLLRVSQGRPLGSLWSWLSVAHDPTCADKPQHMSYSDHDIFVSRLAARTELAFMPGSAEFFDAERPRRADEGDEPDGIP